MVSVSSTCGSMRALTCSPEEAIEIMLDVNTRIQILEELSHLAGARKHQFAAFCRKEQCLVVWADEVETLVPSAEALEQRMLAFVWSGRHNELAEIEAGEKGQNEEGWVDEDADKERELGDLADAEEKIGADGDEWEMRDKRPTMLYAPLVSGLAIILCFAFIGSGMRNLIKEAMLDKSYIRFALLATSPFGYLLGIVGRSEPVQIHDAHSSSSVSVSAVTSGRPLVPSRSATRTRLTTRASSPSE